MNSAILVLRAWREKRGERGRKGKMRERGEEHRRKYSNLFLITEKGRNGNMIAKFVALCLSLPLSHLSLFSSSYFSSFLFFFPLLLLLLPLSLNLKIAKVLY
jgi:hypothetical protein